MTREDVLNIQREWANGIIKMGKLSNDRDELEIFTKEFLKKNYDFENQVLFKPTKAKDIQFRNDLESAISYFIGGSNRKCEEDLGFALSKWIDIKFENSDIIINDHIAHAMGNYTFKSQTSEVKVEYSFSYKSYDTGLKIILHHSSIPYQL